MNLLLSRMSQWASTRPVRVLLALGAVTVVLGGLATQQTTDTAMTAFAPDSELADALERVEEDFGGEGASLQVVVDAGAGGNVLTPDGLRTARDIAQVAEAADLGEVAGALQGPVQSFADPVAAVLAEMETDPASADTEEISEASQVAVAAGAASLLSDDLEMEAGAARAGLVIVPLSSDLSDDETMDVSLALAEQIESGVEAGDLEVSPYNQMVLSNALEEDMEDEMSVLLSLSLLLIVGILLFQYRRVSDVILGFAGLIVTITWMFGLSVLMGPKFLGITGPFTQMSTIVPVLLVGLGVDYAIHLTSRYREEQGRGQAPRQAAGVAVSTVGGALVLATATTVVGFLTNLVSPLPPMADFGLFVSAGVISAFVVMVLLVPTVRSLLDIRRERRIRNGKRRKTRPTAQRPASGFASLVARASRPTERLPIVTLAVAGLITIGATGAATQIETSFNEDDFIPADSDIGQLLDRIEQLFSGDLTETTYVLVDGDLTDPTVANAMLAAQEEMTDVEYVRVNGDAVQVMSPPSLVAGLAGADPDFAQEAQKLGYEPGEAFGAETDLAGLYELARESAPAQAMQVINPDGSAGVMAAATTGGQEHAEDVRDALAVAAAPLEEHGVTLSITSQPLVFEETLDALTASQTRGIAITLAAALVLLAIYFGVKERTPLLGLITMVPSLAVVSWVLATMWLLGINFNVMTAMVASLGIGIGVPYGIHVTNRFLEDHRRHATIDEAVRQTVTHTGAAMAGSAATTAAGFGVLVLASLPPMREFGIIVAITITYSFLAAVLVQPPCLKLWAERRAGGKDSERQARKLAASDGKPSPASAPVASG